MSSTQALFVVGHQCTVSKMSPWTCISNNTLPLLQLVYNQLRTSPVVLQLALLQFLSYSALALCAFMDTAGVLVDCMSVSVWRYNIALVGEASTQCIL